MLYISLFIYNAGHHIMEKRCSENNTLVTFGHLSVSSINFAYSFFFSLILFSFFFPYFFSFFFFGGWKKNRGKNPNTLFLKSFFRFKYLCRGKKNTSTLPRDLGNRPRAILISFLKITEKWNHFFRTKLPEPQESVPEQFECHFWEVHKN